MVQKIYEAIVITSHIALENQIYIPHKLGQIDRLMDQQKKRQNIFGYCKRPVKVTLQKTGEWTSGRTPSLTIFPKNEAAKVNR